MSLSPMHDLPAPHTDGAHHRKEAAPKSKEMKPLFSTEPLPHDREKKPIAQTQKKRKRVIPDTPALTFDPKRNYVPSGRQDSPLSPPTFRRPPASESSTSPYDDPQTTPFVDREMHDQFYSGYDAQKRPRIFSECSSTEHSTSSYPNTPCTDMSSGPPEFHDSPVSNTSSSSPAPSDQSPCAAEFAVQVFDYGRPVQSMYPYGGQLYVQQSVVHQEPYGYPMGPCPDRLAPDYPVQYPEAAHGGPAPHGVPAYPENDDYFYQRRY
ncbi:hypothetical protein HD554DRAFT_2168458 [Boletus coccyginus]|nr:hypothetical protein HD554DRAFT_2168458 [Boletus coccyginus]